MELAEFDKSVVEFSIKELMGNGNSLPLLFLFFVTDETVLKEMLF